jgi:hypothetical protein
MGLTGNEIKSLEQSRHTLSRGKEAKSLNMEVKDCQHQSEIALFPK